MYFSTARATRLSSDAVIVAKPSPVSSSRRHSTSVLRIAMCFSITATFQLIPAEVVSRVMTGVYTDESPNRQSENARLSNNQLVVLCKCLFLMRVTIIVQLIMMTRRHKKSDTQHWTSSRMSCVHDAFSYSSCRWSGSMSSGRSESLQPSCCRAIQNLKAIHLQEGLLFSFKVFLHM